MSVEGFRELLEAKGGVLPDECPSCGITEWGALDEELVLSIRRAAPAGRHGDGRDPTEVLVVAPTCTRCGYMLFFDSAVLSGMSSIQPSS